MQNSTFLLENKQKPHQNPKPELLLWSSPPLHAKKEQRTCSPKPSPWLCPAEHGAGEGRAAMGSRVHILQEHHNSPAVAQPGSPRDQREPLDLPALQAHQRRPSAPEHTLPNITARPFSQLKCWLKYKVKLQICCNMVKLFFIALPRLWYTHLTHVLNPSNTMIGGEQVNLPPQRWNTKQKRQHL